MKSDIKKKALVIAVTSTQGMTKCHSKTTIIISHSERKIKSLQSILRDL